MEQPDSSGFELRNNDSEAWRLVEYYMQPIKAFFSDDQITSIVVNRYDLIFVRKNGEWVQTNAKFESEAQLENCITQIVNALGQSIDPKLAPIADARMSDGSRVNAVLFPTAHLGSNMSIRKFPKIRYSLEDLLSKGSMSPEMLQFFKLCVMARCNTLVSGATGSGKTTLLNALGNLTHEQDRIGVIEDTAELNISKPNMVAMEAPKRSQKAKDGSEFVTMESLLVNTLRQELSTVIVGEVREPKAATALMLALNTGHEGTLSTLHANNPAMALRRVINMLLSNDTRIPYDAVASEIHENFNLIIQAERTPRQGQRIVAVSEIHDGNLRSLFEWDYLAGKHVATFGPADPPNLYKRAAKYGIDMSDPAVKLDL